MRPLLTCENSWVPSFLFLHLIAGEWVEGSRGETFESLNPADSHRRVAVVAKATADDVDRAIQAARTAFAGWRLTPAPRRAEILYRTAELLCRRKQELGELVTREMGKVLVEGLGDVQEAIDMAYYAMVQGGGNKV
ncbi:MAG: aldehyde dehydrogenase family protein [Deltaproteobacteria bacterium]|nr:aldehyde dehydrogenase family protein [Deltaproteobacteria bacterium]